MTLNLKGEFVGITIGPKEFLFLCIVYILIISQEFSKIGDFLNLKVEMMNAFNVNAVS